MFVDPKARVPVTVGENTIFIRSKMSAGVRAAVQDEMRARGYGSEKGPEVGGLGSYRLAILTHNILAWEGPAFVGVKCTRENIALLDLDEPLIDAVAEAIGERNLPPESPDPNAVMTTGSTIDGEAHLIER